MKAKKVEENGLKRGGDPLETMDVGAKPVELIEVNICGACDGYVEEVGRGTEGWSVCEDCGTVEGNNQIMYECPQCEKRYEDADYCETCKE